MSDSRDTELKPVADEALRKLGRNILNLSKIEAGLKYLLSLKQLKWTEETISRNFDISINRYQKQTLGSLVQEFNKDILLDARQDEDREALSDSGFHFFLKITCEDSDFLRFWKRDLADIVIERNKLIHQDLAQINIDSVEDYCNLIDLLDEQNPRLLMHLERIRNILNLVVEIPQKLSKIFEYLQLNPTDDYQMLNHKGIMLANLGGIDEAIIAYDAAITANPNYHEAWDNRGYTLAIAERLDEAIASFDKAIAINPQYANAIYNKGYALSMKGDLEAAFDLLQQAFDIDPQYREMAKIDTDLDSIRADLRFQTLLGREGNCAMKSGF